MHAAPWKMRFTVGDTAFFFLRWGGGERGGNKKLSRRILKDRKISINVLYTVQPGVLVSITAAELYNTSAVNCKHFICDFCWLLPRVTQCQKIKLSIRAGSFLTGLLTGLCVYPVNLHASVYTEWNTKWNTFNMPIVVFFPTNWCQLNDPRQHPVLNTSSICPCYSLHIATCNYTIFQPFSASG